MYKAKTEDSVTENYCICKRCSELLAVAVIWQLCGFLDMANIINIPKLDTCNVSIIINKEQNQGN